MRSERQAKVTKRRPKVMPRRCKLTPPELAARLGVKADKVVAWIRSGELRALNAATKPGGRPRWLIDEADVAAFEARRAAQPVPRCTGRTPRRRPAEAGVIEFY